LTPKPEKIAFIKSKLRPKDQAPVNNWVNIAPTAEVKRRRYIPKNLFSENEENYDAYESATTIPADFTPGRVRAIKPRSSTAHASNARRQEALIGMKQNYS